MSWGATAFTPMISYNTPPFGFHERIQPPDFSTCPENPWSAAENLKEDIKQLNDNHSHRMQTSENFIGNPFNSTGIDYLKLFMWLIVLWFAWKYLLN